MNTDILEYSTRLKAVSFKGLDKLQHRDNLLQKLANTVKGKKGRFRDVADIPRFIDPYFEYVEQLRAAMSNPDGMCFETIVGIYGEYLSDVRARNRKGKGLYFSAQSKYESTILEEFVTILLSPILTSNLRIGPVKIGSGNVIRTFYDRAQDKFVRQTHEEKKDQDIAIYYECEGQKVLVVAIEAKSSYIDKTMMDSTLRNFDIIGQMNTNAMRLIVAESLTLGRDYNLDRTVGYYITKKTGSRDPRGLIKSDPSVFARLYADVDAHIAGIMGEYVSDVDYLIEHGVMSAG